VSRAATILRHRTFREVLDAMARPGTVRTLPDCASGLDALAMVADALLDAETSLSCLCAALTESVIRLGRACACPIVAPEEAAFVVWEGGRLPPSAESLRLGTSDYPDSAATLLWLVDVLGPEGGPRPWSGPGIPGIRHPLVGPLEPMAWDGLALLNAGYPLGLDVVFLDRRGQVLCLPRSTRIGRDER
jgi:alpha-D-ribose 1-methylphosphonate 5-triphosphate synthase subunit PhnH